MPSFNQLLARLSDMFSFGSQIGIPLANRNLFIDGAFDSFTTAGTVSLSAGGSVSAATMYYGSPGVGGVATHQYAGLGGSQNNISPTESAPASALCLVQSTASTGSFASANLPWISQKTEGVHKTAGRSVTLSCKMWATAPVTIPGIWYSQNFGTGGSPSATNTPTKAVTWNVTGAIRKFSVRIDVAPLPAGVTYGTNGNHFCQFGIFMPPSWTGTLFTTEWQLEYSNANSSSDLTGVGGAPTAFEYRGFGPELARVQRFYENGRNRGFAYQTGGAAAAAYVSFAVSKRIVPAMTLANVSASNCSASPAVDNSNGANGFMFYHTATATGTADFTDTWIADARL